MNISKLIGGSGDIKKIILLKKEFCVILSNYIHKYYFTEDKIMEILFFDRVRKPNPDDNKYLEYRKNTKMFYADESLKNLKSEKLRIETRLDDRKRDNAYGALAVVVL